jgi:hypothetical protein
MSNICPFQVNALGYSPFCDIFTGNEWRNFNYARDLATYYGSGYIPISIYDSETNIKSRKSLWPSNGTTMGQRRHKSHETTHIHKPKHLLLIVPPPPFNGKSRS